MNFIITSSDRTLSSLSIGGRKEDRGVFYLKKIVLSDDLQVIKRSQNYVHLPTYIDFKRGKLQNNYLQQHLWNPSLSPAGENAWNREKMLILTLTMNPT